MVARIIKATTILLATLAAGYATLVGVLYVGQESLIFAGTRLPADHQFVFDVPFREQTIDADGAQLNALLFKQPDPRGLIFFLHGNAGNLATWTTGADYYQRVNYDMFMFDYRGFGKSTGRIESEDQLHADVRRAWDSIAGDYADKPIVIYGRSLGAALAIRLAADVDAELVVLVSPFESLLAMAKEQYPFVPERAVRYPFRSDQHIGAVDEPIILVHGDSDVFIPQAHSETLLQLTKAPARLLVINGADHNNIHSYRSYLDGLTKALP